MGQKVNPTGARLGFNKNWSAHWFSDKQYAEFLNEDRQIREYIIKKYPRASIANVQIFRNRSEIVVGIHTAKPGLIIGRSGVGAQDLKATIQKIIAKRPTTTRQTLRVNIQEVKNPELSANIVGETIAGQLERRISVKRAIKQAMERTMEKKAKGIKIKVSGRLGGAEIARAESVSAGSIPLQTIRSDISYALSEAHTTFGIIGIKVWIYLGEQDQLPLEQETENTTSRRNR